MTATEMTVAVVSKSTTASSWVKLNSIVNNDLFHLSYMIFFLNAVDNFETAKILPL